MALTHAWAAKWARTPAKKASSPTYAASCLSTLAPLAYVMPSKFASASSMSSAPLKIGWVDGSWSWL